MPEAPPVGTPEARGSRDGDLPAYVCNGLIGLRVREVPLIAGMAIVSGVAASIASVAWKPPPRLPTRSPATSR